MTPLPVAVSTRPTRRGRGQWRARALCRHDPDLWFDPAWYRLALHICRRHCPVLAECDVERRDLDRIGLPIRGGVMAGLWHNLDGRSDDQHRAPHRHGCTYCPRWEVDE